MMTTPTARALSALVVTCALIEGRLPGLVASPHDPGAARTTAPAFTKVYPLKAEEGVFAYARISPDGRQLVYASEMPDPPGSKVIKRTVTLVDLKTQTMVFTEPGIDAYWSNDGRRMIYRSMPGTGDSVAIRHEETGAVARRIAPVNLGDYYSWAVRDGKDLILTILSNYYYLDGDQGVMPSARVTSCPGIGVGERPLISKDGRRITTFVRGNIVVRDLTDCDDILDTGIQGAKADFSWDGRYIAFHVAKPDLKGYEIQVVDTTRRTVRTVTNLPGSSLFPSWTRDGRLCFRYDGEDYRGFMIEDHVLDAPERPLPPGGAKVPSAPQWADLFPETPLPPHRVNLVMIWATWSAHSPQALVDLQRAGADFRKQRDDAAVWTALEIGSWRSDVDRMRQANGITLPEIPLAPARLTETEALNQIPTTLLFRDGVAIDRRLGAQSYEELRAWVRQALDSRPQLDPRSGSRVRPRR
jgi:hypothetical protein